MTVTGHIAGSTAGSFLCIGRGTGAASSLGRQASRTRRPWSAKQEPRASYNRFVASQGSSFLFRAHATSVIRRLLCGHKLGLSKIAGPTRVLLPEPSSMCYDMVLGVITAQHMRHHVPQSCCTQCTAELAAAPPQVPECYEEPLLRFVHHATQEPDALVSRLLAEYQDRILPGEELSASCNGQVRPCTVVSVEALDSRRKDGAGLAFLRCRSRHAQERHAGQHACQRMPQSWRCSG